MDRIIKLSELEKAVDEVYEQFRNLDEGAVDPALTGVDTKKFGIALTLTDGTTIVRGDADEKAVLGAIGKIPTSILLMSQMKDANQLIEKAGMCKCKCKCDKSQDKPKQKLAVSKRGIRAVSAIEPSGDSDGKWDLMINNMINLMGSAPELDDRYYEARKKANLEEGVENALAAQEFTLYDDAPIAIDLYTRLTAMKASARQLATMAATIAADGYNPVTGQNVFDGTLSSKAVALMAAHGPHKMNTAWLFKAGLPAKRSFGGTICGVLPGVFGIAAYSPLLNEAGISIRAAKAIATLMSEKLGVSVFDSAKLKIEK